MALHPKMNALIARIEAMPGGWDDIFESIADGATMRMLGEKFGVSRSFFNRVMNHDDDRRLRAEAAYRERAHAMVDESIEIADNINPNLPASAQKAKIQIELRQWLAAIDNARYEKKERAIAVNITIGQLHLDALRRRSVDAKITAGPADTRHANANATPLVAPPVMDAEILEITDGQGIVETP